MQRSSHIFHQKTLHLKVKKKVPNTSLALTVYLKNITCTQIETCQSAPNKSAHKQKMLV